MLSLVEYLDVPIAIITTLKTMQLATKVILSVMLKVKAILIDDILNTGRTF